MRKLIIKRNKSFAGCFGKVRVYIEDRNAGDLDIKGCPCRKLGELKNGEEKGFSIDTAQTKVFVIGDAMTRDFCMDWKTIPAGEKDVLLSGKNSFDPQNGNPFVFDK